eukprot:1351650-Prymnesium_polylepis.1
MASFGGSLHARLDWTAPASGGERVSRPPRSNGVAVPGAIARDGQIKTTGGAAGGTRGRTGDYAPTLLYDSP